MNLLWLGMISFGVIIFGSMWSFFGSMWSFSFIYVVFHSDMFLLVSVYSFRLRVRHGWKWIFKNQNPRIPSCSGVIQFDNFLVLLWVSQGAFLPLVLLWVLLTLVSCCLSFRVFCYVFIVSHILHEIVLFPCHPVVGLSLCILPILAGTNLFLLFWNVRICLFVLSRNLFSLLSFASTFWFIFSSCFSSFISIAFFFSSQHIILINLFHHHHHYHHLYLVLVPTYYFN